MHPGTKVDRRERHVQRAWYAEALKAVIAERDAFKDEVAPYIEDLKIAENKLRRILRSRGKRTYDHAVIVEKLRAVTSHRLRKRCRRPRSNGRLSFLPKIGKYAIQHFRSLLAL
jgi:shikimate kinase